MESNKITTKETETTNAEGVQEIKVNTVDHRSTPVGKQGEEKSTTEDIQVIHELQPEDHPAGSGGGGGGSAVLAGAAASVANTVRSAKDAISSSISSSTDDKK